MKEVSKESGAKRKKSLPRKSTRSIVKRQKIEEDAEKEDLKGYLDIVPREDVVEDVESLSTKYPIVDWKTCVLIENFMYYQVFRGDGSSKNYKILSEMLEDFDRQDVMDLHRLVKESDDEEDYQIKRNKFGAPIYGPKLAPYLNCNDPDERSLAIQTVNNPFREISVWKKAVSFLGSLPVPLKQVNWKPDYKGSYTKEEEATGQWRTEIRLTDPYVNVYLQGFTTKKTDRKLSKYHKLSDIMPPNWFME
ncbi:hypothetical protein Tco_0671942 [Tanacetum coccineum]